MSKKKALTVLITESKLKELKHLAVDKVMAHGVLIEFLLNYYKEETKMISLEKGQKIDLTKGNEGLSKIKIGLGWDIDKTNSGSIDLDSAIALVGEDKKTDKESNFIFFGRLNGKGVKHNGDNTTGEGDGDDESIDINLSEIEESVKYIQVHIVSYTGQNFGVVDNTFVRIVNNDNNEELARYDMGEDYSTSKRLHVADIYRHNGEWKVQAIGTGADGNFNSLLEEIGLK